MSRYPAARWAPAGTPGGVITPRVVILHTEATVGKARPHSGLEWHFMVFNDGTLDQLVDTDRRADANNRANGFAISVETEDDGSPDADPWTPAQVEAIVRLCRWANAQHDIPLRRCDRWDGSGIGFHTMWGAPSEWTPVAKTCPGAARKAQFETVILPLLTADPQEDDDMPLNEADKAAIRVIVAEELTQATGTQEKITVADRSEVWRWVRETVIGVRALLGRDGADIDEAEIAGLVLAGLDPAAIAAAIPGDLAEKVADELAERLAG